MPRHPDIVPGQHQYGEAENEGIEHFLAAAAEQIRQSGREQRHHAGAEDAGGDAARDPQGAAGDARGHGHDDADNQAGLEDFAEYDQQGGQHGNLTTRPSFYAFHDMFHGTTR